jgi:hypothetical protein
MYLEPAEQVLGRVTRRLTARAVVAGDTPSLAAPPIEHAVADHGAQPGAERLAITWGPSASGDEGLLDGIVTRTIVAHQRAGQSPRPRAVAPQLVRERRIRNLSHDDYTPPTPRLFD